MAPEPIDLDPPLVVGAVTLIRWIEGHTYESDTGRTFYSGAGEPSQEDADDAVANPRQRPTLATPEIIAEWRWRVENGGVTVAIGGVPHRFDTTRENRSMWLVLRLEAEANPAMTQDWKTLAGVFVPLTAADILTVCAAVYAHVAACFALEAALLANPPDISDLPAAGWPS